MAYGGFISVDLILLLLYIIRCTLSHTCELLLLFCFSTAMEFQEFQVGLVGPGPHKGTVLRGEGGFLSWKRARPTGPI